MRPSLRFLCFFLLLAAPALAQNRYRGMLRVQSTDGTPLSVSIDNRRYEKVGRRLLVGDLPTGRHRLRVYAVYPNRRDDGASAETVYKGVFYAEPGTITDCAIDVARGTAQIRTLDATPRYSDDSREAPLPPAPAPRYSDQTAGSGGTNSSDLEDLRRRVAARTTDADKLQTLKTALDRQSVRTDAIRTMLGWLSFDSTRLEFAKWTYAHVSDRGNYAALEDAFLFDSTKTDFNNYVRSVR